MRGRFIVVEGLEGAGKSTAIAKIKSQLDKNINSPILITREPGGTSIGENIRTWIKEAQTPIEDMAELFLIYAARIQLLHQYIQPEMAKGHWIIADRFEPSTYAYQGGGRGIDKSVIDQISSIALQGFKPDLLLYLDIDPQLGLERAQKRGGLDRIESESLLFFETARRAYLEVLQFYPETIIIDANQTLDKVEADIAKAVYEFLAKIT